MNMNWTIGRRLAAAFGVLMVIQIIVVGFAYRDITRLHQAMGMVNHTKDVVGDLDGLLQALLNCETGERGYVLTGQEPSLDPYQAGLKEIDKDIEDLRRLTADNPNQQRRLDALGPLVAARVEDFRETISLRRGRGFEDALAVVASGKGKTTMDDIRKVLLDMAKEEEDLMAQRQAVAEVTVTGAKTIIVAGSLIAVFFILVAAVLLTRNIARPIKEIAVAAERIAAGDLTVSVAATDRGDEVGTLNRSFRTMVERLRAQMGGLREGIDELSSTSNEILAATTQMAASAAETAAAATQTSATVEEVNQATLVSNEKAKQVAANSAKAEQFSQDGRKAVEENVASINRIREQMEAIAESIVRLSEQSQTIGGVISTVNDLADQSNLLAVNASIEAAKAGEQGKGFAVVAQEVKSLAEQSKQATTQVRGILTDIQKATGAAVMATEQGSKTVDGGVTQGRRAGEAIGVLAQTIAESAQAAQLVAVSSQQQQAGMSQIGLAVRNINQAASQVQVGTQQQEIAAQNLNKLGRKLKQLTEAYKL